MSYRIYYTRDWCGLDSTRLVRFGQRPRPYTRAELAQTHTLVAETDAPSRDDLYHLFQSEAMPRLVRVKIHSLIAAGATDHTSLSCGDVVVADDGTAYECASIGWRRLE